MKYYNTKTGAVIDVKSRLIGGNWQAVEPANSSVKKPAPEKKRKAAKDE